MTDEYKFSYDFVTCVMQPYLPGWQPVSLIPPTIIPRTFFTPYISGAIQYAIDSRLGQQSSGMFDNWFQRLIINMKNFEDLVKHVTIEYCLQDFDYLCFLELFCFIAEFSALAYNYGVTGAPEYAIFYITNILMILGSHSQFADSTWEELNRLAEILYLM